MLVTEVDFHVEFVCLQDHLTLESFIPSMCF